MKAIRTRFARKALYKLFRVARWLATHGQAVGCRAWRNCGRRRFRQSAFLPFLSSVSPRAPKSRSESVASSRTKTERRCKRRIIVYLLPGSYGSQLSLVHDGVTVGPSHATSGGLADLTGHASWRQPQCWWNFAVLRGGAQVHAVRSQIDLRQCASRAEAWARAEFVTPPVSDIFYWVEFDTGLTKSSPPSLTRQVLVPFWVGVLALVVRAHILLPAHDRRA